MYIFDLSALDENRIVHWGNGVSRRLLLQCDRMGYTLTDTIINAGATSLLEYKHHMEACYCIEGEGTVCDQATGTVHEIRPGVGYALDKHDVHVLFARTELRVVCVFLPALVGFESHVIADGDPSAYPAPRVVLFLDVDPSFATETKFIRSLGMSPIFFTDSAHINPNYHAPSTLQAFDRVVDVDTHCVYAMSAVIRALNLNVCGVVTSEDDFIYPASVLARSLGLPHSDLDGIRNAISKAMVRRLLGEMSAVKWSEFRYSGENPVVTGGEGAFFTVGDTEYCLPVIVKPSHDTGTAGAFLCFTVHEVLAAVERLKTETKTYSGDTRGGFLLEEFIGGRFYGAELLWSDGAWKLIAVTKLFVVNPRQSLCMSGIAYPPDLAPNELSVVEEFVLKWVSRVGLKNHGALNVEFKFPERGEQGVPALVEINPRMAGGHVNELISWHSGFSPVGHLLHQAVGLCPPAPISADNTSSNRRYCAVSYIFPPHAGKIVGIDDSALDKSHCLWVSTRGFPVVVETGKPSFHNIVAYVVASGDSCDEAFVNSQKLAENVVVVYG